jgi:hypothetical protein
MKADRESVSFLLVEFPFVDLGSRSAALSGLIAPVVRGALKCVPAHSVSCTCGDLQPRGLCKMSCAAKAFASVSSSHATSM